MEVVEKGVFMGSKIIYMLFFINTIWIMAGGIWFLVNVLSKHNHLAERLFIVFFNSLQFHDEDKISSIDDLKMDEEN